MTDATGNAKRPAMTLQAECDFVRRFKFIRRLGEFGPHRDERRRHGGNDEQIDCANAQRHVSAPPAEEASSQACNLDDALTGPGSSFRLLRLDLAPHDPSRGDRCLVGVEVGERSAGGIAIDHRLLVFEHLGVFVECGAIHLE